ncbi:hypothetical protein [Aeromonas caviae]
MPTLIQGLVALATDPTVKASALLRKVFVATRQLSSQSGPPGSTMS